MRGSRPETAIVQTAPPDSPPYDIAFQLAPPSVDFAAFPLPPPAYTTSGSSGSTAIAWTDPSRPATIPSSFVAAQCVQCAAPSDDAHTPFLVRA